MKASFLIIAAILLGCFSVQAQKPDLQCFESLAADADNTLDVFYKTNQYGNRYQIIHVHYGLDIKGYGRLMAGQKYDNQADNFNYLDNGNCTEGVSLSVVKEKSVHSLIFKCSIDSGPSDWVRVATLVCL